MKYIQQFDKIFFDIDDTDHSEIKRRLNNATDLIGEMVERYVEIINELCLRDDNKEMDYIIILLARKICESLDAIAVLLSQSCVDQARNILRSLYEICLQVDYILDSDTENREASYHIGALYENLEYAKKFDDNFPEGVNFRDSIGQAQFDKIKINYPEYEKSVMKAINSKPILNAVNQLRISKLGNKKRIKWYNICSASTNLKELAEFMGWENYHSEIYGGLSIETHGLNVISSNVKVDAHGATVSLIRLPINSATLVRLACTLSMDILKGIYSYLVLTETDLIEFQKFYISFREKRKSITESLEKITV